MSALSQFQPDRRAPRVVRPYRSDIQPVSLSAAIAGLSFERPETKPTSWARITCTEYGQIRIGVLHSDYECANLHAHGMFSSMVIPLGGPLAQFLKRCTHCQQRPRQEEIEEAMTEAMD